MASPAQTTNRSRAPLAELPLHHFVSQSLACSPKSSPEKLLKTPSRSRSRSPSLSRSRTGSVSVSPHKQALLQNHRLVREGSVASPSSSSAQPSNSSDQVENMTDAELAVLPRRLFGDRPAKQAGSDLSLEASPIVSRSTGAESRFSPRNVKNLAHHSTTSRPTTPKGATTTPLNVRQHRPPHTSGPKPAQLVEPSPTTQRMSEPRLGRRGDLKQVPSTPSRPRSQASSSVKAFSQEIAAPVDTAKEAGSGIRTPLEEPSRSTSSTALQSLPKKKHRVSRTEIAIAHEEAGAGPIASPSPRKMADYFSPAQEDAKAPALSRLRSDSISDRQQPVAALRDLTDLMAMSAVDSLTLAKSGLFLGVVARPMPGWTVYEDPVLSSDTAPSQDHHQQSPMDSPVQSVPSTPNKENRVPDASFLAAKVVPLALPDRAYSVDVLPPVASVSPGKKRSSSRLASASASPVTAAVGSRKRGTGGRLSLLADADAEAEVGGGEEEEVGESGKKVKGASQQSSPLVGRRKASASQHQRKASAGSRKASSVYGVEVGDGVASRTRSRTRA